MALRIGPTCGGRCTTRVGGRARSLLPWGVGVYESLRGWAGGSRPRQSRDARAPASGEKSLAKSAPGRGSSPGRSVGPRSGETWPRRRRLRGKDSKRSVVNARRRGLHHGTTKKCSFSVPARPARYQSFSPRAAAIRAAADHRRASVRLKRPRTGPAESSAQNRAAAASGCSCRQKNWPPVTASRSRAHPERNLTKSKSGPEMRS
jgi:hypothetical protein